MRDNDWQHVHITESTLSFGDKTYNLENKLSIENNVPHFYFGQDKGNNNSVSNENGADASQIESGKSMGKNGEEDDDDDESEEDVDEADESQWTI